MSVVRAKLPDDFPRGRLIEDLAGRLARHPGIERVAANSPKSVLQHAYRLGWLEHEQRWLKLLGDRNLNSHTYRESLALEIYRRIPSHHAAMREAVQKLPAIS